MVAAVSTSELKGKSALDGRGSVYFGAGPSGPVMNRAAWTGVDAEVFLLRSCFGLVNFTREWGRDHLTPTNELLDAGLSYQF